jgi:hypothetical protein
MSARTLLITFGSLDCWAKTLSIGRSLSIRNTPAGFRPRRAERAEHPQFGGATSIYNVIDSRQSDPQSNVIEALRGLGYVARLRGTRIFL